MTPSDTSSSGSAVPTPSGEREIAGDAQKLVENLGDARDQIQKVIYGQGEVIDETLITLLSGGHALLVGVPGLGKTLLVETLGSVMGLGETRIQFTPDLMPADILGSEVLEEDSSGKRSFRFVKGPIFTQLLMADEINRASPRTQAALLQAMQESRVSIAGEYHDLPRPFHVLATQNPIEQEGTYPLPEAQLDRFLMQIDISYPDTGSERDIILNTTGLAQHKVHETLSAQQLAEAQTLVRQVPVGESVIDAILTVVRNGRPETSDIDVVRDYVAWGPGPRASQALMLASRARALLTGRYAPSVDDVIALAKPVLRHRMALGFAARAEGLTIDQVITTLTDQLG